MSKYEQLIEYIINEQEDEARALFHSIVVEKSREIYESILEDEEEVDEDEDSEEVDESIGGNEVESLVDEVTIDEEGMEEDADEEDADEEDEDGIDGEITDMDDMGAADMGDDSEPATIGDVEQSEQRILDELQAKFDELMDMVSSGDADAEMDMDADMDADAEMGSDFDADSDEGAEDMMYEAKKEMMAKKDAKDAKDAKGKKKMTEAEWLREYTEKLGDIYSQEPASGEGHEVGKGKKASVAAKSIVAGKNDMGGTAKNLNQADKGEDPDDKQTPEPNNEYSKGRGKVKHADQWKNKVGGSTGKPEASGKPDYVHSKGAEGQTTGGKVAVSDKSPLKHIGK